MKVEAEQVLCRFHVSNFAKHGWGRSLYEWIVETAHRQGLQGATVLRGFMGLRQDGSLLEAKAWAVGQELPIVVEVVDSPQRIEALLAIVEPEFEKGEITLERAHVLIYRARGDAGQAAAPRADVIASQGASAAWGVKTMKVPEEGVLLRIFIGEDDRDPGSDRPLYEAIVRRAREAHLAGATVLKGPMGFGRHSRMHTAKLLELSRTESARSCPSWTSS